MGLRECGIQDEKFKTQTLDGGRQRTNDQRREGFEERDEGTR